jgi:hypothetical protein
MTANGRILYKYLASSRWNDIFVKRLIRFTQPSVFNDPFEMQPFYESLNLDPNIEQELTEENASEVLEQLFERALPKVPVEMRQLIPRDFLKFFAHIAGPLAVEAAPIVLEEATSSISSGI